MLTSIKGENMTNNTYILNAIPGAVIPSKGAIIKIQPCSWSVFKRIVEGGAISAVGHQDTAGLITALSGTSVPMNRVSIPSLEPGDVHLLALYKGPRLPEGSTTLPEGATLEPYILYVL